MHVLLTAPGFEAALIEEIDRADAGDAKLLANGVVGLEARCRPEETDFVFARHIRLDAVEIRGESVSALADGALFPWVPILDADEAPWELQAFIPDEHLEAHVLERRAELVGEKIAEALKKRRKRVLRRKVDSGARKLAQVLLVDRDRGFASLADRLALPGGGLWPSAFPAGRAEIADDWDAPSSAYRKLEEALAWLPVKVRPKDRVVDLGAAPGGWTHVALRLGADVQAIDKAELDPKIAANPRLSRVSKDAFNFEPEDPPVDWLLTDVIAEPEKLLSLLLRWTKNNWCKHFVAHLKFKGDTNYGLIDDALRGLRAAGYKGVRAKKLLHDKNEVTLMA